MNAAPAAQPSTAGREYAVVLGALAAAAAIMLAALGQVWVQVTVGAAEPDQPRIMLSYTGRDLVPVAAGAAILLLAGVAGVVATRRVGRLVVAAVLMLAALAAGGSAIAFGLRAEQLGRERALAEAGATGEVAVSGSSWWLAVAAAAVVALVAAIAVVLRSRRWPVLGGRYERPGSATGRPDVLTASQAWDALDRGEDPTRAAEVSE